MNLSSSSSSNVSRRRFLADCGKMTGIGAMSSLLSLNLTSKLAAQNNQVFNDYKGLVCIFMFGGLDSYNLLLPGQAGYSDYLSTRGILGINQNDALDINAIYQGSTLDFHVNPEATGIQSMFAAKDLSFVANVGTLVQPTTISQHNNGSVPLPYGRFSHNDQIEQWQVSYSTSKTSPFAGTGWAGRILDIINDSANSAATVSASLAPFGANITQVGRNVTPFLTNGGVDALDLYAETDSLVRLGIDATLETQYASILQAHHNFIRQQSLDQSAELEDIEQNTVIETDFPDSSLGDQMLQIAKYIKANRDNGGSPIAKRQTFFAGLGGFDSHGGGIDVVNNRIATVSAAMTAFNTCIKDELQMHDEVTTYTASDFGRSLTPNSAGSDHAWGGNQMVMGGAVAGGEVFGNYPEIRLGTDTDVGRGRQLPTTSIDELHASLARWFGITNSDLAQVVPNIGNFWSPSDSTYPIDGLFGA